MITPRTGAESVCPNLAKSHATCGGHLSYVATDGVCAARCLLGVRCAGPRRPDVLVRGIARTERLQLEISLALTGPGVYQLSVGVAKPILHRANLIHIF